FMNGWPVGLIAGMSILYSVNMYFQSYGALSVVKVNASWFHVRERGVLGGVFGSMISAGYALAYGVCGWILANAPLWAVYVVPSCVILVMFGVDFFLVRDRPGDAGHDDFDTGDERVAGGDESPGFFAVTKHVLSH